ncbi:MAG: cysteine--tRNA ligase, partial [Holosporales bacterium]
MPIVLYNTLSHQKEPFRPLKPDQVGLYVCGPTVYDTAHIGNARSVVVFDILYRLLCFLYPKVTYVRNITDIDDKIIAAAREKKLDILQLTQQTTEKFHQDMASLQALSPTHEPRATAYVPQ